MPDDRGDGAGMPRGGALRSIVVFRALQLGDMLVAVPALRALRHWAPHAHIVLVGLPWAAAFCDRFAAYIDEFVAFPGIREFPEQPANDAAMPAFLARMRAQRFDLALQLHGSGEVANALVARFGAAAMAAFTPVGEHPGPLCVRWPDQGHEIERLLRLVVHLGAEARGTALEFPIGADDIAQAERLVGTSMRYAVVHPGARLRSRRWPTERFAECARRLAAEGLHIVLTGASSEQALVDALASMMPMPALNLAGKTSLGGLAAIAARASLVITNDTGMSHVSAAVGTPSVVIVLGSDPARWAPLDRMRHRIVATDVPCRPCMHDVCPIGHLCAQPVTADTVLQEALPMLHATCSGA
jgi:ADP-heptose:LPS heptosyltransferase